MTVALIGKLKPKMLDWCQIEGHVDFLNSMVGGHLNFFGQGSQLSYRPSPQNILNSKANAMFPTLTHYLHR
jgi:hypothetical protein